MARIDGLDAVKRAMRGSVPSRGTVERTVKKWSEYVRGEAVDRAPVDTGALRQSIHTDVEWAGDECLGIVYTNLEYGPYVEFGTGRRGAQAPPQLPPGMSIAYSTAIKGQVAQPYLWPALHNNEQRIMRGIQEDLS